jgi:16S rRNA (guanine527-N7)-methyltransferase
MWEYFKKEAEKFNIYLNTEQMEQFKLFYEVLKDYNQKVNLISSTDLEFLINRHFLDSLSVGLLKDKIDRNKELNIIDIGIGGGFPGIPIIIAFPEWKLTAVDSIEKKTKFIDILSKNLGINKNVNIINSRAEELAHNDELRGKFDFAFCRAVSSLNVLAEISLPFLKKGGYLISYKAKEPEIEIKLSQNAISKLGGKKDSIINYNLPAETPLERNLIIIKKETATPAMYPRKINIIKKNPL